MLQRIASKTRTVCPYCGVGCGLVVRREGDGTVGVAGDPDHPANFGRLCSKGSALAETLSLGDRLLHPLVNGRRAGWDVALDLVADRFMQTIAEHGSDAVAFYVSGQLLTEDYYVANKLMKGFIGSGNIDTNSRLCMASSVAGHKRAFGSDTVPGTYRDLEEADLVVLVGSNLAWCHPVLFQRLQAAKAARPEMVIVAVDPRRTMTAEGADLHLALRPGSDVALFNGLLAHLVAAGAGDRDFVARHTNGVDAALAALEGAGLAETAAVTGLPVADLHRFYDLFARTRKVVTAYSQGVNQSSAGTDKVNGIVNCHLYTGRIGRPGMGPFSITGQPNAMGGREVGGLANQLACHMELDNPVHRQAVQDFWGAPAVANRSGLKAVELFEAVRAGKVKAIWIAGTNPVDSLPDADRVRAALAACPFVVVSDVARHTDTTACAHVLLPAAAWGEKDGTVTNSERRISRQRGFLPLPGEAQPDWWIFAAVGRRMGWAEAFSFESPAEIFAEYAALSGFRNNGTRDFDISAHAGITRDAYGNLMPFQWPLPAAGHEVDGEEKRFFAAGGFFTPDRRARFLPTPYRPAKGSVGPHYPLVLNTGRIRDQWHTMTRTAKTPRLMAHVAEPFVELHPDDAAARGIAQGDLAVVESPHGRVIVRAEVTILQRQGSAFVPMHWTDQFAAAGRIDAVVNSHTDPVSGQPELKFTPVQVQPFLAAWHGFAVVMNRPAGLSTAYWAIAPAKGGGWRVELADTAMPEAWDAFAGDLLGVSGEGDMLAYHDGAAGQHRYAVFRDGSLHGALFVAPQPVTAARGWLIGQVGRVLAEPQARLRLLAGRAGDAAADPGAIVCSCFDIGANQIAAVVDKGCRSVDAVGAALQAGTNCGSCRSEIRKLIDARQLQNAG